MFRDMKCAKKYIILLLLTGFSYCNAVAQPSLGNQKITITNFSAYEKDNKLVIDWATDGTVATNYWQVQASTDGTQFSTIALVLGPDPRQQGDRYQYMEKIKTGVEPKKYFRVRHVAVNGSEQLSEIIKPAK
jgi:hypothetical protein